MSPPRWANSVKARTSIWACLELLFLVVVSSDDNTEVADFHFILLLLFQEYVRPGLRIAPSTRHRAHINAYTPAESWTFFRFRPSDLSYLVQIFGFPHLIRAGPPGHACVFRGEEGLLLLLRRLASPCRLVDLIDEFGLFESELSFLFNWTLDFIFDNFGHLLDDVSMWLPHIPNFADAVNRRSGVPLNAWSFVDGTIRSIARPTVGQQSQFKFSLHLAACAVFVFFFSPIQLASCS